MNAPTPEFLPGSLVSARGREWIVLPESDTQTLRLRPLGGGDRDETLVYLPLERQPVAPATFAWPTVEQARNHSASQLLLDALQLKLRSGAGPFRSFGRAAIIAATCPAAGSDDMRSARSGSVTTLSVRTK